MRGCWVLRMLNKIVALVIAKAIAIVIVKVTVIVKVKVIKDKGAVFGMSK